MNEMLNSIRISGRISREPVYDHTIFGEAFYRMEVAVKRLSGFDDILPVTVSERLLGDPSVNACSPGALVAVSGQIRSYNQRRGDRSHLIITVFAREVEFLPDFISEGDAASYADIEAPVPINEDPAQQAEAEAASQSPVRQECNDVELCGAICKPVIYRTTPFSREIADVLLAVNRRYGKSDYLPCIAWGRNARFAATLEVGERIIIHGRLQSRTYQKALPDGTSEQRTAYEISCSSIERQLF